MNATVYPVSKSPLACFEQAAEAPAGIAKGNRCGHDPDAPRWWLKKPFTPPKQKGSEPRILQEIAQRVLKYYSNPKLIPSLNAARSFYSRKGQPNKSAPRLSSLVRLLDRQQRSERREAIVLLLVAMLRNMDLTTLRVGIPTPQGFLNVDLKWLAAQCGLSIHRAKRAHRDLVAANIVTANQARMIEPSTTSPTGVVYRGLASARAINKALFAVLGLAERLRYERKKAVKRLRKKVEQHQQQADRDGQGTRTSRARLGLFLGAMAKQAKNEAPQKPRRAAQPESAPPVNTEGLRQIQLEAVRIRQADPSIEAQEALKQARARLGL